MNTKLILIGLLLTSTVLFSCGGGETGNGEAAVASEAEVGNALEVTSTQFSGSNMEMGKMQPQEFHRGVRATGVIDVPPESKASVSAYFGGYVKQLSILPGKAVGRGEALFVMENPAYVEIQQDFLEAKGQLAYLRSDYERQKMLASENVSSQKQYLKAESDYTVTLVRYESLKKKLAMMNIDAEKLEAGKLRSQIVVTAPISGYVTKVSANVGQFLNPSDVALRIVNTEHLHLEINIFEKDLASVKVGQTILFRLQNESNTTHEAHVHLINKTVDPEKRTIAIHGHLNDEESPHSFAPGMYLEAEILTQSEKHPALPEEAVVELDGTNYVLLKTAGQGGAVSLRQEKVEVGQHGGGFVEILNHADFAPGEEFLVKGAFGLVNGD